ncbi:MAG: RNA polymerase sigma factor [Bacteroidetes bacterium]|nr:RNA polymerase sigma factor [Bacteroidota bacterium]
MALRKNNIIQTIKLYGQQLFAFIRSRVPTKEDAEDILQDVWYQLSNQPSLENIDSMSGWLYRVARNKITDQYRRKKEDSLDYFVSDDEDGLNMIDFFLADDENKDTKELQQMFWETLMSALDELPANQREVFILNEFEEKTLQQIADLQHEKLKTIISRKRYAVLYLRKRLEDLYNEFINY